MLRYHDEYRDRLFRRLRAHRLLSPWTNLDDSALFNQRHHGILQTQTLGFKVIGRVCRSYSMRLANDDTNFGEGSRQYESVPTFESPTTRVFHVDRQNCRSGLLREINDARTKFVDRTARTIRRDDHVATRCEHIR